MQAKALEIMCNLLVKKVVFMAMTLQGCCGEAPYRCGGDEDTPSFMDKLHSRNDAMVTGGTGGDSKVRLSLMTHTSFGL